MRLITAFLAGALFGAGLHVSGMTDTARVQGFLDIFGQWDPTLGFVMAGALLPMAAAWRVAARRDRALSGDPFPDASREGLTMRLAAGSVLFGTGWGISGLCPGPALAASSYGGPSLWIFLASMLVGMALTAPLTARFARSAQTR